MLCIKSLLVINIYDIFIKKKKKRRLMCNYRLVNSSRPELILESREKNPAILAVSVLWCVQV